MDFARFNRFGGYPHTLDLPRGQFNADALQVGMKRAFVAFDNMSANSAALLALTFADDYASPMGSLASDYTNSRHRFFYFVERGDKVYAMDSKPF